MKTLLFTLIALFFNELIIAQIIDCELLTNIDNLTNKSIVENSFSKNEIAVNEGLTKGMIISEKEIKLINGSFGNAKDSSYMLVAISTCDVATKQNDSFDELESNHSSNLNEQKLLIYPNPSKDFVTINWSKKSISMVSLISIEGKILNNQTINHEINEVKFDLSTLSSGIYQIVITENGKTETYKIIKN